MISSMLCISVTAVVVLVGAVFGTVYFDSAAGEFLWFQGAYDEPFYLFEIMTRQRSLDHRLASRIVAAAASWLGVASFDGVAFAYAALVPLAALFFAYRVSRFFAEDTLSRSAWTLALVFAFDLFSFSSLLFFSESPISRISKIVNANWLISYDAVPYFILFRRPEPQTSWVFMFLYLVILMRSFHEMSIRHYRVACIMLPVTSLVYVNVGLVIVVIFAVASVLAILFLRWRILREFSVAMLATAASFMLVFLQPSAGEMAGAASYATRIPIVRISVVMSLAALAGLLLQHHRAHWRLSGRDCLAVALLLVPLITLNQQIVTGRAVIAQNWEFNVNYLCLVAGVGFGYRPIWTRFSTNVFVALSIWGGLLSLVAFGTLANRDAFLRTNLVSVAQARAYNAATAAAGPVDQVVLPHFWDESLFLTRVPRAAPVLGGYNWLIHHQPPRLQPQDDLADHLRAAGPSIAAGFETLARRGVSPEQLGLTMREEVLRGICWPTLMYFFSVTDCWLPFTNFRSSAQQTLLDAIPGIVREYDVFRKALGQSSAKARTVLITNERLPEASGDAMVSNRLVAQASVAASGQTVNAYAYVQMISAARP
jgi:hypothetical protein